MSRTRILLAITISFLSLVTMGVAYAAVPYINAPCTPTGNTGTNGPDVMTCNNTNNDIDGKKGDDTITVTNGGSPSQDITVSGGQGNDTITSNGKFFGIIDGGQGNDTITNNGTIIPCGCGTGIQGGDGNDTITNNGTVKGDVRGGNGNDTLNNNGTIDGNLYGGDDNGQDIYNNNGLVKGDINAHKGSNTINNAGDVKGDINLGNCDGCTNVVILTDGATVKGTIQGDSKKSTTGTRTLEFNLTVSDSQINALANQIAAASPLNGNITINGVKYKWKNLTGLVNLLKVAIAAAGGFEDGRINPHDLDQTITGWCRPNGDLNIWSVNGTGKGLSLFTVTPTQLAKALKQAMSEGKNILIKEQDGRQLWALKSNELQIHDSRGGQKYDFIFPSIKCGILPTV